MVVFEDHINYRNTNIRIMMMMSIINGLPEIVNNF